MGQVWADMKKRNRRLKKALPFLLHDLVSELYDDHITLLVYLIRISAIVFSESVTQFMICELEDLINCHHNLFKRLFPTRDMFNKHHYVLHYAKNILDRGPMYLSSCLRFEPKHSPIKQQVINGKNFKNVPKSIMKRQLLKQNCYIKSAIFESYTISKKTSKFYHGSKFLSKAFIIAKCCEVHMEPYACLIKTISLNNVEYRPNFVIIIDDKYSCERTIY